METIIQQVEKIIAGAWGIRVEDVAKVIEIPRDEKMGDLAFPCFILAKRMKKAPAEIAKELASSLLTELPVEKVVAAGPYVNFFLSRESVAETVIKNIFEKGEKYGSSDAGAGKTVVIDFSSPNIAKPLGVHHLRSTMLGNALHKMHSEIGFKCVGINYLGDWGTQFGQLIAALKKRQDELNIEEISVKELLDLYVQFHEERETGEAEELDEEARGWFKKLEEGDDEARRLWQAFKKASVKEFERIYSRLGVSFDVYSGESKYNEKIAQVIKLLAEKALVTESEGALIVDLEKHDMPPCLLRKRDGATLYATRDLAAAIDRYNAYKFDRMLYVVALQQRLHFRQVFKVLELLGFDWAKRCIHVDFGMLSFGEEAFSTRRGKIVFLEDVLDKAVELAESIIEEKNPALENKKEVAEVVGIGAIIFSELSQKRIKDKVFSWQEILNFDGETGPYVQYTYVRLGGILRKYEGAPRAEVDFGLLKEDEEFSLLKNLDQFGSIILRACDTYEPYLLANYLLEICSRFNAFYQKHRVISGDKKLTEARIALVSAIRLVIRKGLSLLGVRVPEKM